MDWEELQLHVTEISTRTLALYSRTDPWLYAVQSQRLVSGGQRSSKKCPQYLLSFSFLKLKQTQTHLCVECSFSHSVVVLYTSYILQKKY